MNPHDNLMMIITSLQMLKLRQGHTSGRAGIRTLSLNLEPVIAVQCCLSLEKHVMKIKNHGPNSTSRQVLFPLYRASKLSDFA